MSVRACISALLLSLMLMAGGGVADAALSTGVVTLAPGTTAVPLGESIFVVSTDRTISVSLTFVTGDLLDVLVVLRDTSPALVQIVWRDTGVIVFAGPVAQVKTARCRLPEKSIEVDDSGHTEK